MSAVLWASALEAIRELRWWFPPSQSSCSLSGILLGAIFIGAFCFCCGALVSACLLSSKCRIWIWHCVTSACAIWYELPAARGRVELRSRFREYHSAWVGSSSLCTTLWPPFSKQVCPGLPGSPNLTWTLLVLLNRLFRSSQALHFPLVWSQVEWLLVSSFGLILHPPWLSGLWSNIRRILYSNCFTPPQLLNWIKLYHLIWINFALIVICCTQIWFGLREVPTCRIFSQISSKLKGLASALAAIGETGNPAKTLRPQSEWESRETRYPPPVNHLGSAGRDRFENLWCKNHRETGGTSQQCTQCSWCACWSQGRSLACQTNLGGHDALQDQRDRHELAEPVEGAEVRVLAHLVRCRVSGFMVLLPALEEVFALLEQLVDGDGDSLVVQKEVDVPLEDARGRRFGSGQMVGGYARRVCGSFRAHSGLARQRRCRFVADDGPELYCAPPCEELTKLQNSGSASWPKRTKFCWSISLPKSRRCKERQSNVSPEVVQQLQARIAQRETQQAAPSGGLAPVVDLEPRPHAAGKSVLFAPGTVAGAVPPGTLERLRSLAGPPPGRLARTEALADENPAPQQAFAHAEAEVEAEDEVSQVLNASSDPLHQLLALQMKQTAALMQKLAPPTRDPVTAALGSEGGSSQSGVKGCVARDAYLRTMEDVKGTGRSIASDAAV